MATARLQSIGKYDILREIGRGSMGVVYLGNDPFTGREVAIKVALQELLPDTTDSARYRKMFFNEAKVAGRLRHPNIVQVHDAGVERDVWFIVMEYVQGARTLYDYSRAGNLLPIEDVVRVVFKCARALDFAHRQGVVHRDIKPRNLLLSSQQEVKIADFSVALLTRADATDTQVRGYVGSPLYMSPEQIRDENIGPSSDLFSLGVVLYELLAGKHPFAADTLPAIIHNIQHRAHVPIATLRPDVPPVLVQIIDRLLKKDARGRYRAGMDVAADLSLVFEHVQLFEEELSGREKFNLVRDLQFFHEFADPEIWEIINACHWKDYPPDTQIIVEGDVDNAFYVIVAGEVSVLKGGTLLDVLRAGDCFGEMGFIGNRERTATIVAKSDVTVMKVRASLLEHVSLHCQLRFHKVFLGTLIGRLSKASERLSSG